jgi:hypothetical protein
MIRTVRINSGAFRVVRLLTFLSFVFAFTARARGVETVIISEVMASNSRSIADENKSFADWIELRNTGTTAVNLEGWSLADSRRRPRQWLFPATNLAPNAHLMIWASGRNRRVAGAPLHANFKLSSSGEYLGLVRPDGSVASEFTPQFPPQLPDVSYGFLPGITHSVFFTMPTPGKANESSPTLPGPLITSVTHRPAFPRSNEAVVISAQLSPLLAPVTNVTLFWRAMFHRETNLAMTPDDIGVWTATIPAGVAGDGQILRWRLVAEDAGGHKSQQPLFNDPKRTSKYLGTVVNPSYVTSALPLFQLFIPLQQMRGAESESGARGCFFYDGEFYDNVFIKVRGNSTAGFPKKSHRLEFPHEHALRHPGPGSRLQQTSLMAEWGDPTYLRQYLSFWLQRETGSAAPFHYPVRVQLNGEFWQLAMHSEVLGEELLARHGLDPNGALYKAVGTLTSDFESTGVFEKKTRRHEGNADYLTLASALNEARGVEVRRQALFEMMNVPAVINYLAVARITQEDDDIWANLSLYRDCEGTEEWRPVAFDMNVSWGLSFGRSGVHATADAFRSHPFFGAAGVGVNQGFNRLYDAVVCVPETREMLLRRMRTVLDSRWQPPGTPWNGRVIERHITQLTNLIWAEAIRDRRKWGDSWNGSGSSRPEEALTSGVRELIEKFIEPRRRHFYVTHSVTNAARTIGISSRNSVGLPERQVSDAKVRIAELGHSQTNQALAYLCLTNGNPFAVDISGWRLEGPVKFAFPAATVLPARGTLYVAADVKELRARLSALGARGRFIVGNYRGQLSQERGIALKDEHGRLVDEQ